MPSTVLINGQSYVWANISVIILGVPVIGITSINYKRKQDKKNNYGKGVEPVSRGYGKKEYEGDFSVYLEVWKQIIAAAPGNDVLSIPPFDIPVLFSGDGVATTKDVLKSAEFLEDPLESKEGDTSIICKIPLIIGGITRF